MSKKNKKIILENIYISDYAAEGKALAKHGGKAIFIAGAAPGDVADIVVTKNKKDWAEARVIQIKQYATERTAPFCQHFGTCGGCKWQMLPYEKQLEYKQQEAEQNLRRISKVDLPPLLPIIGSEKTRHYRNKLEFTFSNKRYLTTEEIKQAGTLTQQNALGFHVPKIFDKVIDIEECHLMHNVNNTIRNTIRTFALQNEFSFYDIKKHTGWLRNIMIRYCTTGELMVNICFHFDEEDNRKKLFDHLLKKVPSITTLLYTINIQWNESIYNLTPQIYTGKGFVIEELDTGIEEVKLRFKISAKSFFQTNTLQAEKLYKLVCDFAGFTGTEVVYDLYCGTGSIGIFISKLVQKIIGVDVVEEAIADARENAEMNNISNTYFVAGDVIKICNNDFFNIHGRPDIVITDPPRVGMHEKLTNKLLEIEAPKIVYVSCNTATQARDIALLSEKYQVRKIQPVDMFPHTHHIESVALLTLK